MLMNYPSKHLLLRRKGKLLEHSNSLKGFRNTPDKRRSITKAMLAGRQYFVSAGNRLKRHSPGGGTTPPGT